MVRRQNAAAEGSPILSSYVTTSWDDCQKQDEKLSNLLLKYGVRGTFYVPKYFQDHPINVSLVRYLDKDFEIGAHSLSHSVLTNVTLKCAFDEIKKSKEWLEQTLHREVEIFSYPGGKYNLQIADLVKQIGFRGARVLDFGTSFPKNPFMLRVGPQASNGSPLLRLESVVRLRLPFGSLMDWQNNAKAIFDHVLKNGGIFHLWGHSWELERNDDWKKLEAVLAHISNRKDATYVENGHLIRLASARPDLARALSLKER